MIAAIGVNAASTRRLHNFQLFAYGEGRLQTTTKPQAREGRVQQIITPDKLRLHPERDCTLAINANGKENEARAIEGLPQAHFVADAHAANAATASVRIRSGASDASKCESRSVMKRPAANVTAATFALRVSARLVRSDVFIVPPQVQRPVQNPGTARLEPAAGRTGSAMFFRVLRTEVVEGRR